LVATGFPPPMGSGSTGSRAGAVIDVRTSMRKILCFM
jgi:hypothetical protein